MISGSLSAPLSRRDAKESTILGNSLAKTHIHSEYERC